MHSVELRSHFCLGRLCERRRYSRTPKLATPLVTCSQRKVVTTPEENACFSYTFFLRISLYELQEGSMILKALAEGNNLWKRLRVPTPSPLS